MSSNTIYTTQIWDDSELEILYKFHNKESCSQISKKYLNKKSAKHISKKCKELNLDKYFNIWTPEEIQILKEKWETIHDNFILINIFPRWNIAAIDRKAYQLKLKKSDEVVLLQKNKAKNSLIIRNKTEIGRDMKYDFAKNEVLKYKSKQEMYKLDNSLYQFIHKNKLWDDLCGFMVIGNNFNYPQTFLYYCIKKLYENCEIIMKVCLIYCNSVC